MRFGYNTNGFAHHRLEDALRILADLGYQSVAITLDHHALNPYADDLPQQLQEIGALLSRLRLRTVIETGARFLLSPWNKHQPTLLDPDPSARQRRFEFLTRAIDIAAELRADAVSFWSGSPISNEPASVLEARLTKACDGLARYAEDRQVCLAFEPEPGMFIDTMEEYDRLSRQIASPRFGHTLDIGHLHCIGEVPIADQLRRWQSHLWNIHIEDMRRGVHEHLMFGEGEIDFAPILQALQEIGYRGGIHVELSRHSHDAVNTARRALAFLRGLTQADS
jgi:sugar phosphate isomerase/epimerase